MQARHRLWILPFSLVAAVCFGQSVSASLLDSEHTAGDPGSEATKPAPLLEVLLAGDCRLNAEVRTDERASCWSLSCPGEPVKSLGCDHSTLHQLTDLQGSPDQQFLAVMSVGEGHPILEVVRLRPLLDRGLYEVPCTINPYPGTFGSVSWQGSVLSVASSVALDITSNEERVASMDAGDHTFRVDPETCRMAKW